MDPITDTKKETEPGSQSDLASAKESTGSVPMIDLEEAIKLISTIHENALERAAMPQVAKAAGYAHASSTPFYRRVVAARLFGLMAPSGPELSVRASNYLKPDADESKQRAMTDAILGIPTYADLVQKHLGKRLNVELVANGIEKTLNVTPSCAATCARAFASSLKFAGMIHTDGTVRNQGRAAGSSDSDKSANSALVGQGVEAADKQTQTLYLDATDKSKTMTVSGPVTLTRAQYERIISWIAVTWFVPERAGRTEPGAE